MPHDPMPHESAKIAARRSELFGKVHILRHQMHASVDALCNQLTGPIQNPLENLASHEIFAHDKAELAGFRAGDAMRDLESFVSDVAPKLRREMEKIVEDYIDEAKEAS